MYVQLECGEAFTRIVNPSSLMLSATPGGNVLHQSLVWSLSTVGGGGGCSAVGYDGEKAAAGEK